MKAYACYPRMRYQPGLARFARPHVPQYRPATEMERKASIPAANIIRQEAGYAIELVIPGLTKEQIHIEVEKDQLIISAVKPESSETPKYTRQEFDYAGFKRVFRLHQNADTTRLTASFHQGILTIVIPDKEPETIKIHVQ